MKTIKLSCVLISAALLISACGKPSSVFVGEFTPAAENLDFPEGPVFIGEKLYFSNCYGQWIGVFNPGAGTDTLAFFGGSDIKTNGLAADDAGNLWACDYGTGRILRIDPVSGDVEAAFDENGIPFNRPNDIAFYDGFLWFTDPKSYNPDKPDGRIFRMNPKTGNVLLFADSLAFPNGIVFAPDGSCIYVCESARRQITEIQANDPLKRRAVVTLPGGDPDGILFDAEGKLFCAHFGGGAVFRVDKETGAICDSISTPGRKPSNVELSPDGKKLYVTETETNKIYQIGISLF